jgi:hypothetical protein
MERQWSALLGHPRTVNILSLYMCLTLMKDVNKILLFTFRGVISHKKIALL